MNKYNQCRLFSGLMMIALTTISVPVAAASKSDQVSYSPEHWPTRWSSAIHQQQSAKFPTRNNTQLPPGELPTAVSEQDLFYSPNESRQYRNSNRPYQYNKQYSGQRFSRDQGQYMRDAAYAYQRRLRAMPTGYNTINSMPGSYTGSMPVMDPVLGHPSFAVPIYPGQQNMYPMGGLPSSGMFPFGGFSFFGGPFGYPVNMGFWSAPLRV